MAGAGFKTWVDGDILTAADLNTYLMEQAVMVFATATARTTALPTPSEGMVSYLADSNVVEVYTGAAWVSLDDPNAIQNSIVDAKGDLISATADNTPARLAVGTNGQVLTADSTTATGLKWAAAAGGGALVKVGMASPSAVSGVNIDNVFTSTYRNYLIQVELTGTNGVALVMQYRASGSTDTNTNYNFQQFLANGTTLTGARSTSQSSQRVGSINNGGVTNLAIFVYNPQQTKATTYRSITHDPSGADNFSGPMLNDFAGNFSATTSFDGFRLSAANNFTGTIKVYGFED